MLKTTLLNCILIGFLMSLFFMACRNGHKEQVQTSTTENLETATQKEIDSLVYHSNDLIIRKIAPKVYEHTSFLTTESFGKVPCNGMVVVDKHEAIVFDTPADAQASEELIGYFTETKTYDIKGIIATHFHADCVGGLEIFHKYHIPSYASYRTITLLKQQKENVSIPQNGFKDALELAVGDNQVEAAFFGEGHTKDNIIGYFPEDRVLFGGCLIKEQGAGKGNVEDATVEVWSETVEKIKQKYQETKIVIPGHGKRGGVELLDYTIQLFK